MNGPRCVGVDSAIILYRIESTTSGRGKGEGRGVKKEKCFVRCISMMKLWL